MNRKLTIGIMHSGTYCSIHSTLQAIRMYHSEVLNKIEIIVLDSHPMQTDGDKLKLSLLSGELRGIPVRYMANNRCTGTSYKALISEHVSTPYFLYIEPGTLLSAGSIEKLINYFDNNLDKGFGILQGVEFDFTLQNYVTHTNFEWCDGKFGHDAKDVRVELSSDNAFEVDGVRLKTFAYRVDAVKNIKLFGTKFTLNSENMDNLYCDRALRNAGLKIGCLPFLKYTCSEPSASDKVKFRIESTDVYNYTMAFLELNMHDDLNTMIDEKSSIMDPLKVKNIVETIKTQVFKL